MFFLGSQPKTSPFGNGNLLAKVETAEQSEKMRALKTLDGTLVNVVPH